MPPDYYGKPTIRQWEPKLLGTSSSSTFPTVSCSALAEILGQIDVLNLHSFIADALPFYSGKLYKHLLYTSEKGQKNICVNQACHRNSAGNFQPFSGCLMKHILTPNLFSSLCPEATHRSSAFLQKEGVS